MSDTHQQQNPGEQLRQDPAVQVRQQAPEQQETSEFGDVSNYRELNAIGTGNFLHKIFCPESG